MNILQTSLSALALAACLGGTAQASNGAFDFLPRVRAGAANCVRWQCRTG